MPALEAGDVEARRKVLAINPTCSYTLRKEYGELVGTPAAAKVTTATMDLNEYLWQRKQEGLLDRNFQSTPGKVAYHLPCHLKAQNIGFRARDMLRLIPDAQVRMIEQCSGHDGTWAMKKELFPLSMLAGKKAFDEMKDVDAETYATDCPLAARPIHPIQVLARAYRPGGFPTAIEPVKPTEE